MKNKKDFFYKMNNRSYSLARTETSGIKLSIIKEKFEDYSPFSALVFLKRKEALKVFVESLAAIFGLISSLYFFYCRQLIHVSLLLATTCFYYLIFYHSAFIFKAVLTILFIYFICDQDCLHAQLFFAIVLRSSIIT